MGRPHEAEDAFDQCLARLRQGETVEACLLSLPHLAGELAPLLVTASALLALAAAAPNPPPALARARTRILRLARQARPPPRSLPRTFHSVIASAVGAKQSPTRAGHCERRRREAIPNPRWSLRAP